MTRQQRDQFVQQALTPAQREVLGEILIDPLGNHRVRIGLTGCGFSMEFSHGEALEAIEKLKSGVAELTFEEGRDRVLQRPVVRGI